MHAVCHISDIVSSGMGIRMGWVWLSLEKPYQVLGVDNRMSVPEEASQGTICLHSRDSTP